MLTRMKVERGDLLHLVETPDGFLAVNHRRLETTQIDAIETMLSLARR
jgi:hypothetical protein